MSLPTPIERWTNRLLLQRETAFGAASDEEVREFTGKHRFSYSPVLGAGATRVGLHRLRNQSTTGTRHWQAAAESEYQHGQLASALFGLLFELVSEELDTPTAGLTTVTYRLRRLSGMMSAKLGLEYEPTGPYYIMHGVVVDAIRLSATARNCAKLRLDFKGRELEEIPSTRTYIHDPITQYNQSNFLTEVIGGPCYEDAASGMSCRLAAGGMVLATEDGYTLITEDGFELLLEDERVFTEPQPGSLFSVYVNDKLLSATEVSFEGREEKVPARFDRSAMPGVFRPGQPLASGELALYMTGGAIPAVVAANSEASVRMVADFGSGRSLTVNMARVKFNSGTPELVGRNELVYRAPFSVLEPLDSGAADSFVTLVI